jgi:hypothetical protein
MKNGFFDIQELGTMPTQSMENKGTLVARANDHKFAMSISHWLASRENWTHARNCNAFLYTCMLFVHWLRNNKRRRRRLYLGMMTR